jgi:Transposase IS116/IS110/IS902 family
MDLATIQSGTFRGHTKLSKYGNARLRRTLWMAGQVAIQHRTNSFRDKFERYIAKTPIGHVSRKRQFIRKFWNGRNTSACDFFAGDDGSIHALKCHEHSNR